PKIVQQPSTPTIADAAHEPTPGLDAYEVVRDFLDQSGNKGAANTYLTDEAKASWPRQPVQPLISLDRFRQQPKSAAVPETESKTKVIVEVTARQFGYLKSDGSFFPQESDIVRTIVVQLQPSGQWRISAPPPELLMTKEVFNAAYRQVQLHFFDPEQRVLVPDTRYLPPSEGIEADVMEMLRDGPSEVLSASVRSPMAGIEEFGNTRKLPDGTIVVNLKKVDSPPDERRRLAAQIVTSLRQVSTGQVRLLVENRSLLPEKENWRASDFDSYLRLALPTSDLFGLVAVGGKIRSMRDGEPIKGPAGLGGYTIRSAAQSLDGSELAVVDEGPTGPRLRIGRTEGELHEVSLSTVPSALTRPTWLLGDESDRPGSEVWTVVNSTSVVRVVRNPDGRWQESAVDAMDLTRGGGTISQLRLSRDGVRVAAVVNGQVKVASVLRGNGTVAIRSPRTLQEKTLKDVVGVDWADPVTLIVVCRQNSIPVATVSIDGQNLQHWVDSPLTLPVQWVTASPNRQPIVTDGSGMWQSKGPTSTWQRHPFTEGAASMPFYPG
ncbi:MAG: LpqB family beta-propeller domain-containing protein, partial [Actinomycetota bacterium]|nr:LpqB family beta-propeller domain-containing protein [Actinomycetota bacterium]